MKYCMYLSEPEIANGDLKVSKAFDLRIFSVEPPNFV